MLHKLFMVTGTGLFHSILMSHHAWLVNVILMPKTQSSFYFQMNETNGFNVITGYRISTIKFRIFYLLVWKVKIRNFANSFIWFWNLIVILREKYSLISKRWSWSQWPRGLRYVQSSTVRTLGSWVRIPLEAWMCVHVFLCCPVLCR
jgi:hypothetical protein